MKNPKRNRLRRAAIAGVLLVLLVAVACAQRNATLDPRLTAKADGPSGLKWIGGDRESPFMHPGVSCIACHSKGEGPRFQVAGTVYANIDEKDDWLGVEGAEVQLSDKKGTVVSLTTNKSGNFFSGRRDAALTFPATVKVLKGKAENAMQSPAPSGDCLACHTAKGANGAPGRVIAP
jgi:mono/diheme cytochrome c family protein